MSASTTTPAEAGTYRNRPTWATKSPDVELDYLCWHEVLEDGEFWQVGLSRRDGRTGDTYDNRTDPTSMFCRVMGDHDYTPTDARRLAALLVQAADLAEQS